MHTLDPAVELTASFHAPQSAEPVATDSPLPETVVVPDTAPRLAETLYVDTVTDSPVVEPEVAVEATESSTVTVTTEAPAQPGSDAPVTPTIWIHKTEEPAVSLIETEDEDTLENEEPQANGFAALDLSPEMLKAVAAMGYTQPSPIQAEAIPHLLEGRDLIGQAQTGSGKTAAFAIPVIEKLDPTDRSIQALVLCPTRELVLQVAEQCRQLMAHHRGCKVVAVYGGEDIKRQMKALSVNPQLVIGTPGRTMDLMRRDYLDFSETRMVVLDEADEMLDMGFREDMETILGSIPEESRQTILFSATMAPRILKITEDFQVDPVIINVSRQTLDKPKIEQFYSVVKEPHKPEALYRLAVFHQLASAVVFCNTKAKVEEVVEYCRSRNLRAEALHGDLNQNARTRVISAFKAGYFDLLVATDVAGRGIDIQNLEAVINFDLPRDDEDYVHRIGRTGRAGQQGRAFTLINGRQVSVLRRIVQSNQGKITDHPIPLSHQIEEGSLKSLTEQLRVKLAEANPSQDLYLRQVDQMLAEQPDARLLAAALLAQMHGQTRLDLDPKWDAAFIATQEEEARFAANRRSGGGGGNYSGPQRDQPRGGYERRQAERGGYGRKREGGGGFRREEGGFRDRPAFGKTDAGRSFDRPFEAKAPRSFDKPFEGRSEAPRAPRSFDKPYEPKVGRNADKTFESKGPRKPFVAESGIPTASPRKKKPEAVTAGGDAPWYEGFASGKPKSKSVKAKGADTPKPKKAKAKLK